MRPAQNVVRLIAICGALAAFRPGVAAADPTTPPATQEGDRQRKAEAAAQRGFEAYGRGEFNEAVAAYTESYQVFPTAEALFNLANIYDKKLNDPKLAIEFYRRYNASYDANPDLIPRSTARIAELSAAKEKSNAPAATTPSAEPPKGSWSSTKTVAVVAMGAGVIGLGIGAIFGLSASSKHSEAEDAGCSGKVCLNEAGASKERDAGKAGTISTIGFVAGGVMLATGIGVYLFAPRGASGKSEAKSSAVRVSGGATHQSATISLTGTF
jgi:tetratricopeptide (TPR) repeat protein